MKPSVIIENPIINSPFQSPERHFRLTKDGISDVIEKGRRISVYTVPVPKPKTKGKQKILFETQETEQQLQENKLINQIRERIATWRIGRHYLGVTRTSKRLLAYWQREERERRLFFCQIEAMETLIYLTEVAKTVGDSWILKELRQANESSNPLLDRLACKMATGSGKTVIMAMLIAWQVLNYLEDKKANKRSSLFSDAFLIVTPGITIRDRLRVLLPNDPQNYYRKMDIVPPENRADLGKAAIVITNFHAFRPRETSDAGRLTKNILIRNKDNPFIETPDETVRRVCRDLGNKKNIVVINDEAHHCYRRKPETEQEKLKGDERKAVEKREEYARIWISGIEAVKAKIGLKAVYDLSATPFFLRGSGYSEGTLFPWVVSDFSLIDAIECGIVKVPRVPVADNAVAGEQPTYRDIWLRIRKDLPKQGRKKEAISGEPELPVVLEGALQSLYENYMKYYQIWEQNAESRTDALTPPVFIVVCNNTNVSKLIFDYIAGWEKELSDGSTRIVPGRLPVFSNERDGRWRRRPNTILIDSEQLESGDAMNPEFKQIASREIEEFKDEYRARFPGREIGDEDLLREVMNTVGKPGKLGEHIKCVVSVSMLTEGWDANTVTHILGVRAFGTQLLCEQVVGRGLRRMSYVPQPCSVTVNGETVRFEAFAAEYAEVYGVPFAFIPCAGTRAEPKPGLVPTRVYALEERVIREITFPRLTGYRYDLSDEKLSFCFTEESNLTLSTLDIPTETENAPLIGASSIHTLDDLKKHRIQEVVFLLAKLVLEKYFRDDENHIRQWLFPQILEISRQWLNKCLLCKDDVFPQMLLLAEPSHNAADRIYRSIAAAESGKKILKPVLQPYDTLGSTQHIDFETTRSTYLTRADKCHISHVVADTEIWEQKTAQSLEDMDEVFSYTKNMNLGFTIPYTVDGEQRLYLPDFIVRIDDGKGTSDLLNLIIETTGREKRDKEAKTATARSLWIPAVNNHGGFGRWAFLEIREPWNAKHEIREAIRQ